MIYDPERVFCPIFKMDELKVENFAAKGQEIGRAGALPKVGYLLKVTPSSNS